MPYALNYLSDVQVQAFIGLSKATARPRSEGLNITELYTDFDSDPTPQEHAFHEALLALTPHQVCELALLMYLGKKPMLSNVQDVQSLWDHLLQQNTGHLIQRLTERRRTLYVYLKQALLNLVPLHQLSLHA